MRRPMRRLRVLDSLRRELDGMLNRKFRTDDPRHRVAVPRCIVALAAQSAPAEVPVPGEPPAAAPATAAPAGAPRRRQSCPQCRRSCPQCRRIRRRVPRLRLSRPKLPHPVLRNQSHRPPRHPSSTARRAVRTRWVAAANPLAVDAGLEILRKGGKALDAAVAMQAMLGLVEPQSSGVGGGAFLMYYEASTGKVKAIDGREMAPAGGAAGDVPGRARQADAVRRGGAQRPLDRRARGDRHALRGAGAVGALPWKELFAAGDPCRE